MGTYFLLNAENYHWHWTAFGAGASTCGRHCAARPPPPLASANLARRLAVGAAVCDELWRTLVLPSSPWDAALYVLLYSVHYFVAKTKMTGFFQAGSALPRLRRLACAAPSGCLDSWPALPGLPARLCVQGAGWVGGPGGWLRRPYSAHCRTHASSHRPLSISDTPPCSAWA